MGRHQTCDRDHLGTALTGLWLAAQAAALLLLGMQVPYAVEHAAPVAAAPDLPQPGT
ncbi:hypothetical protein ABH925_006928 [Streptacidiphilus sp. EB129]